MELETVFPFCFLVPDKVIFLEGNGLCQPQNPGFHVLPPSLQILAPPSSVVGPVACILRGDCSVVYRLRVRVISCSGGKCIAETWRPIQIFPSSKEIAPPICIGDFPFEYRTSATRDMCNAPKAVLFPLKQGRGVLSLKTAEPPPLVLSRHKKLSTTTIQLGLEYTQPPKSASGIATLFSPPPLCYGNVHVELLATIFFSVSPQNNGLPRQQDAIVARSFLAKACWVHSHQDRKLKFSSWKMDRASGYSGKSKLIIQYEAS